MNSAIRNLAAAASLLAISGSPAFGKSKAGNSSRAQFLDEVWVSPKLRGQAISALFTSVYFAPVSTGRLKEQGWWASQNVRTKEHLDADVRKLAHYMHSSLVNAQKNNGGLRRLKIVNHPGPGTLTIQTAITELVPAKAFWNAAATAAGFVVPGAGLLGAVGKGTIGIEGCLRDDKGVVIAEFRTRENDKFAAINVASYTWYEGAKGNIDDLAAKTAQILNAPSGEIVNRSSAFKLIAL